MHHDLNINIEYAVFNQFYFSTLLYWKEQCKCNRMGVGIYYHQMGKSDPKSNPHVTVRSHPEAESESKPWPSGLLHKHPRWLGRATLKPAAQIWWCGVIQRSPGSALAGGCGPDLPLDSLTVTSDTGCRSSFLHASFSAMGPGCRPLSCASAFIRDALTC